MLYERKQEHEKIIDCYIHDEARKSHVFSFLHKIISIKPNKKDEICEKFKYYLDVSLFGLQKNNPA